MIRRIIGKGVREKERREREREKGEKENSATIITLLFSHGTVR